MPKEVIISVSAALITTLIVGAMGYTILISENSMMIKSQSEKIQELKTQQNEHRKSLAHMSNELVRMSELRGIVDDIKAQQVKNTDFIKLGDEENRIRVTKLQLLFAKNHPAENMLSLASSSKLKDMDISEVDELAKLIQFTPAVSISSGGTNASWTSDLMAQAISGEHADIGLDVEDASAITNLVEDYNISHEDVLEFSEFVNGDAASE
ncbi:hypothetical protein [Cobetia sp. MB87]|uniref:hypothetical protein n=1 Tax=Cobetia sp. MB87 TaxID=2588451 RepID=UPI00140A92C6|nr:hypothetical protein [Cobetia sp. MB87]NHH85193.1 hypothetical protein [Cobetia sp. MB87]